jgi:hypothetical protein
MEDAAVLERHFAGATCRELADELGVASPETAAKRVREAKRTYLTDLAGSLLVGSKTEEALWFVVPATNGEELRAALTHFAWVADEMDSLCLPCHVHVVEKPDGICLGLSLTKSGSTPQKEN